MKMLKVLLVATISFLCIPYTRVKDWNGHLYLHFHSQRCVPTRP